MLEELQPKLPITHSFGESLIYTPKHKVSPEVTWIKALPHKTALSKHQNTGSNTETQTQAAQSNCQAARRRAGVLNNSRTSEHR